LLQCINVNLKLKIAIEYQVVITEVQLTYGRYGKILWRWHFLSKVRRLWVHHRRLNFSQYFLHHVVA